MLISVFLFIFICSLGTDKFCTPVSVDYINTSHPSFVGGTKVVELAKHEVLPPKTSASLSVHKVVLFPHYIL